MLPVLAVAGALLVTAQMHRLGGGVIASELHSVFGLSPAEIGLVMGAMPLASTLVQVPMGLAFDRFGTRRTISSTTLVALLGTVILAFAAGAAELALGRFLIGVGLAGVVTALLLLTMRWAPPERYASIASTVLATASMAGGLLATVPLGYLLQAAGWTPTFVAISVMTLVVIALCHLVVRDGPAGGAVRSANPEPLRESLRGLLAVLADADLRRVMAMATCVIAPFMCIGALWAGPYLQVVQGLGPGEASWVLLSMVIAVNIGTFIYGPLDRWLGGRRRVVLGGAGVTMVALLAIALWPSPGLWQAIVLLHLVAIASPFYVTLTAHSRSFVPVERAGRVLTTINLFGLGSAFAAQWITGFLVELPGGGSEGLGSEAGFRLAFGFLALMLAGAILVYRMAPERPTQVPGASEVRV
jgi:predicted MFS family arabinose efflux permease